MDTENVALLATGALTKLEMVHFTASVDPPTPEDSPGPVKDMTSCLATASKVTEFAETLVEEPTEQSAACGCCCKDAANNKLDTVMDVMG